MTPFDTQFGPLAGPYRRPTRLRRWWRAVRAFFLSSTPCL
jgi:hypothetical protein